VNLERIYQLSRYGNLLVVNAAVGGKDDLVRKVKLLLDTGSSYTVLRSNILENIGCDLEKPSQTIRTLTPGGMVSAPIIAYIIDSSPYKQNRYTPVTHFPILPPSRLKLDPVDAVIVMAPRFSEEIVNQLKEDVQFTGTIAVLEGTKLTVI